MSHAPLLAADRTIREKQLLAAAKKERRQVDPDVRAARARLMQEQDDKATIAQETRETIRSGPEETFRAAMAQLDDDTLDALRRVIGGMSGSRMATMCDTVSTDRVRAAHAASMLARTNAAPASTKV